MREKKPINKSKKEKNKNAIFFFIRSGSIIIQLPNILKTRSHVSKSKKREDKLLRFSLIS